MKKPRAMLEAKLPFSGFYNSLWSEEIDSQENQHCEYEAEYRQAEDGVAPELRLDESEQLDIYMSATNYAAAYAQISRDYVDGFDAECAEKFGFPLRLNYSLMTSPREYNFETDRLFANMPLAIAYLLFRMSRANGHAAFTEQVKARFTSRSGFISYYSNDPADYLEKPLRDWDHNELEALFAACLAIKAEKYDDGLAMAIYYRLANSECFYSAWADAVDWQKVEKLTAEKREEKAAELLAICPDYVAPPLRCDKTLDLFSDQKGA